MIATKKTTFLLSCGAVIVSTLIAFIAGYSKGRFDCESDLLSGDLAFNEHFYKLALRGDTNRIRSGLEMRLMGELMEYQDLTNSMLFSFAPNTHTLNDSNLHSRINWGRKIVSELQFFSFPESGLHFTNGVAKIGALKGSEILDSNGSFEGHKTNWVWDPSDHERRK